MINLKNLLNESALPSPKDATDVKEYVYDFQELVVQEYPKLNGWISRLDSHSGAVEWYKPGTKGPNIYATPFWEERPWLPINIQDYEGDEVYDKVFKFIPTYDRKKDLATYKKMMLPILKLADKI